MLSIRADLAAAYHFTNAVKCAHTCLGQVVEAPVGGVRACVSVAGVQVGVSLHHRPPAISSGSGAVQLRSSSLPPPPLRLSCNLGSDT